MIILVFGMVVWLVVRLVLKYFFLLEFIKMYFHFDFVGSKWQIEGDACLYELYTPK